MSTIIDGLWKGERKCIDPKAGDADLWRKIWEELSASRERSVEVEHVKAWEADLGGHLALLGSDG